MIMSYISAFLVYRLCIVSRYKTFTCHEMSSETVIVNLLHLRKFLKCMKLKSYCKGTLSIAFLTSNFDPHRYTRRVKEAIQIRLHYNNINRDNGIEIPEAWMPTIRKHNSRSTTKRTPEGTSSASRNNEDRNTPITVNQRA